MRTFLLFSLFILTASIFIFSQFWEGNYCIDSDSHVSTGKLSDDEKSVDSVVQAVEHLVLNFGYLSFVSDEFGYEGEKNSQGERHGIGKLLDRKQSFHVGEWRRNLRHGLGKSFDKDTGDMYIGEWRFDLQHGKGILKTGDGDIYRGDWKAGAQDGFGIYHWNMNSNISKPSSERGFRQYRGQWRLGNPHGIGTWENDEMKHEGQWVDGKRHGKALVIRKWDGKVLFNGFYANDKPMKS